MGDGKVGVMFMGWTHDEPEPDTWVSPAASDGGIWTARMSFEGIIGLGGEVDLRRGRWALRPPNSRPLWGTILGGTVAWPLDIGTDIGCGTGAATFDADISPRFRRSMAGTIVGCRDDTHRLIPPPIWGVLALD